ncbi:MAG TPA: DUF692 family protein [Candidatus Polarisedimenticolia bacterium]|jgi:hypothetical protein
MTQDRISVGSFYNPHIARETLEIGHLIDHLSMADPPRADDPYFERVRGSFTLLLHDFIGQLSEPVDEQAVSRARDLIARYRSPWAAEHLQRVHTTDGRHAVDYVFPPIYTEDLLADYIANARALREALGLPLAIEPIPTWLSLDIAHLSEAEFLHRFYEASGCDFLLDVAHEVISARSAGRDAREFIADLPLHRVTEIHVAGTSLDPVLQDDWIGVEPPGPEILDLMMFAAERAPRLAAVTYDAFSRALSAATQERAVRAMRERLGIWK